MTGICGVPRAEQPKETLYGSGNQSAKSLADLQLAPLDVVKNRYSQTDMFATSNTRVLQPGNYADTTVSCDVPGMPGARDKVTVNARSGAISGSRMVKGPQDAQIQELMIDQKSGTIREARNTGNTMPNAEVDRQ